MPVPPAAATEPMAMLEAASAAGKRWAPGFVEFPTSAAMTTATTVEAATPRAVATPARANAVCAM